MKIHLLLLLSTLLTASNSFAQSGVFKTTVIDVTGEYRNKMKSVIPNDMGFGGLGGLGGLGGGLGGIGCLPTDPWCGTLPDPIYGGGGKLDLSTLLTLGQKVWDFIVTNKPTADYKTLKAAVLPGGATNWAQLKGWSRPVAKIYRVEFKNIFGKSAGGFDYRIVFIHGGSYQGKGKYIGQISFAPLNIHLKTDRALNVKAELLDALNFGTEDNPIAGAQLIVTWNSQTTLRYTMNSMEYFLYGTGEIQDMTNGSSPERME